MGGQKPHLLVQRDEQSGRGDRRSICALHQILRRRQACRHAVAHPSSFPGARCRTGETYDYISRNRFVTRYAYHHGYFDGVEREFRGFGRVDQWDTEEFATLSGPTISRKPSTRTRPRTFRPSDEDLVSHRRVLRRIGDFQASRARILPRRRFQRRHRRSERRRNSSPCCSTIRFCPGPSCFPTAPASPTIFPARRCARPAARFAARFCARRSTLSTTPTRPIVLTASPNATTRSKSLQPQGPNRYGVFLAHPRETIDYHYERKLFKVVGNTLADQNCTSADAKNAADPRVTHAIDAGRRSVWKRAAIRGRWVRAAISRSGTHARGSIQAKHSR